MKLEVRKDNSRTFFTELLTDFSNYPTFHNKFRSKEDTIALDVGCGFPRYLIKFNERFCLNKAVCVDKKNEDELVVEVIKSLKKESDLCDVKTISEFYFKTGGGKVKSVVEFNDIFIGDSFFGVDVVEALSKMDLKADLILCFNFLHLEELKGKVEFFINIIIKKSKPDSLILFRIEESPNLSFDTFKSIIGKYFNEGTFIQYANEIPRPALFFLNWKN